MPKSVWARMRYIEEEDQEASTVHIAVQPRCYCEHLYEEAVQPWWIFVKIISVVLHYMYYIDNVPRIPYDIVSNCMSLMYDHTHCKLACTIVGKIKTKMCTLCCINKYPVFHFRQNASESSSGMVIVVWVCISNIFGNGRFHNIQRETNLC